VARHYPDVDDLLRACPPVVSELVALGSYLVGQRRLDDADIVLSRALQLAPEDLHIRRQLLAVALEARHGAVAIDRARGLVERAPSEDARRLLARALILNAELAEAGKVFDGLHDRGPETFRLGIELATAYVRADQLDRARARLDAMNWVRGPTEQIQWHQTRAAIERKAGNTRQAEWEQAQADRLTKREP